MTENYNVRSCTMAPSDLNKWAKEEMLAAIRDKVKEIVDQPEITFDECHAVRKQGRRVFKFLGQEADF